MIFPLHPQVSKEWQRRLYSWTRFAMDWTCGTIDTNLLRKSKQINIRWIIELYDAHPHKEKFFDSKLSNQMNTIEVQIGVAAFREQIIAGKPEKEIRASWEPGLSEYKKMRLKYLLYP